MSSSRRLHRKQQAERLRQSGRKQVLPSTDNSPESIHTQRRIGLPSIYEAKKNIPDYVQQKSIHGRKYTLTSTERSPTKRSIHETKNTLSLAERSPIKGKKYEGKNKLNVIDLLPLENSTLKANTSLYLAEKSSIEKTKHGAKNVSNAIDRRLPEERTHETKHSLSLTEKTPINVRYNEEKDKEKSTLNVTHRRPPQGLQNIGNSCYVNALLQILCQTPHLLELVSANVENSKGERQFRSKQVTCALKELLQQDNSRAKIHLFQNSVSTRANEFRIGYQDDCHSFLLRLVCELHDEDSSEGISRLFEAKMIEEFRFGSCQHREVTDIQMLRSLTIPSDSRTVEEGIRTLLSAEEFNENDIPCRTCKTTGYKTTEKTMRFCHLPRVLVLQLGCFQEMQSGGHLHITKSSSKISYDEFLHVPFMNDGHVNYSLYGVVNHHGSIYSGHYTSFVKHFSTLSEEGCWYYCNDNHVRKTSVREVLQSHDAYLLFYKQEL